MHTIITFQKVSKSIWAEASPPFGPKERVFLAVQDISIGDLVTD